jgi:hypothetical protein
VDTLFNPLSNQNITLHGSTPDALQNQTYLQITTKINNYYNRTLVVKNKPLNGKSSIVTEIVIDVNVTGCEMSEITPVTDLPTDL